MQKADNNTHSEVLVPDGDIDMVLETHHFAYVMEFKKGNNPMEALKPIDSKGYFLSWSSDGRKVFKMGIEYSSEKKEHHRQEN